MPAARQIAEMLNVALSGMDSVISVLAKIGVLVAVGVAFGNVAVCVPTPIDTNAIFGPSLTIRTELPSDGNAAEVLAVAVTLTGNVLACAENGMVRDMLYPRSFLYFVFHPHLIECGGIVEYCDAAYGCLCLRSR